MWPNYRFLEILPLIDLLHEYETSGFQRLPFNFQFSYYQSHLEAYPTDLCKKSNFIYLVTTLGSKQ